MFPAILGQALATAALSNSTLTPGRTVSVPRQRAELLRFVKAFNHAWTVDADEATLRDCLHRSVRNADGNRLELRLNLARTAQIVEWKETDVQMELYGGGQMAVVHYRYELALAKFGHISTQSGRELLVLVREGGQWYIVADTADDDAAFGAGCGRELTNGTKARSAATPPRHHAAPRWIECDYTPPSDALIA